jgi:hypothetical protein
MPDIKELAKAASESAHDPQLFLVLGFLVLAFLAAKLVPSGRGGTAAWMFLVLLAVGVYTRLIMQYLPERPQVQLSSQGFPPVHAGLPQRNGCWCDQSVLDVAFVNADGLKQVATVDAVAGKPLRFGWDADYICHRQTINEYPSSPSDASKNLGKIEFDDQFAAVLPDIYGVATVTYGRPTGQHPHVVRATVVANCVDTHAANCGYPGHQCVATGTLTINVTRK